jgi:hypothetical protein
VVFDYIQQEIIRVNDYVYSKQDFDSSPIVIPQYKLVFFTVSEVADVTWRCLFRRMMGFNDWRNVSRQFEGLRYLYDYSVSEATTMMTSPNYTRAIFVRDPRTRILSSYVKNVVKDKGELLRRECCQFDTDDCVNDAMKFRGFLKMASWRCDQPYWRPQGRRMEPKYYSLLNFVGHYETIQEDAKGLLRQIGAWDDYGRSGWGEKGEKVIFHQVQMLDDSSVKKYFSKRKIVDAFYHVYNVDYEILNFNLSRNN